MIHPRELDIDEVLDFLVSLNEHDQVNWRTRKMYPDDKCQDKLWQDLGTIGPTCWKMMNLLIKFFIQKNIPACQRF